jgi:hypothetical protein
MAYAIQLDLFESNDPVTLLQKDFRLLDKKCQNIQRGLFARYATLEESIEILRDLCYSQKNEIEMLKEKLGIEPKVVEINLGK